MFARIDGMPPGLRSTLICLAATLVHRSKQGDQRCSATLMQNQRVRAATSEPLESIATPGVISTKSASARFPAHWPYPLTDCSLGKASLVGVDVFLTKIRHLAALVHAILRLRPPAKTGSTARTPRIAWTTQRCWQNGVNKRLIHSRKGDLRKGKSQEANRSVSRRVGRR